MLLEKGRCLRVAEWCQAGHRLLGIEPACEEGGGLFRRRHRGYLVHDGRRLRVRRLVVAHVDAGLVDAHAACRTRRTRRNALLPSENDATLGNQHNYL